MSLLEPGGIDCDIHPAVPNIRALHPYLSDHWRDIVVQRGVHELESIAYPANSPLTSRPDWRLPNGKPGSDLDVGGQRNTQDHATITPDEGHFRGALDHAASQRTEPGSVGAPTRGTT